MSSSVQPPAVSMNNLNCINAFKKLSFRSANSITWPFITKKRKSERESETESERERESEKERERASLFSRNIPVN